MSRSRKVFRRPQQPQRTASGTALAVVGALLTVLLLGASAATLGLAFPPAYERAQEWQAAGPCAPGGTSSSCVSTRILEVTGTSQLRAGRAVRYNVHLRHPRQGALHEAREYTVALSDKKPIHAEAEAGDQVTVEFWRDKPQRIERDGTRQWARDAAAGGDRVPLGSGLALLPLGALLAWLTRLGWKWGARPVPKIRNSSGLVVMGLVVVALAGGFAAPELLDGAARPIAVALGLDVVLGAALIAFVKTRARHTVTLITS